MVVKLNVASWRTLVRLCKVHGCRAFLDVLGVSDVLESRDTNDRVSRLVAWNALFVEHFYVHTF